ncbi:CopM family metallochaperone [Shinella sp. M31]|uniref:CopM family metallochaperone n=1 Tax=Shinella sp. M31 TaxID=3368615 RepID=UPI003BA34CA8
MNAKTLFLGAALSLAFTLPALAQEADHSAHQGMTMDAPADGSPSTQAFIDANAKMHAAMEIDFTGNADVDFVRGMIAHHQGAIDMAKVELEHGKDADIRKLAEDVITAQEGEIAMMKEWLAKNAK